MKRLPMGCLRGCLGAQKVACFSCAKSHRNFRQLTTKLSVNKDVQWLPSLGHVSVPGNQKLPGDCPESCQ